MTRTREDFMGIASGFLDGVEVDITGALFAIGYGEYADTISQNAGDAKIPVVLVLTMESAELERPTEQQYSVGDQSLWEIIDDGKAVRRIKDPDKEQFSRNCNAFRVVEAMAEAIGGGDIEKGQNIFVKNDVPMTNVAFYTGYRFEMGTKEFSRTIDKKEVKSNLTLPVKYISRGDAKAAPAEKKEEKIADEDELDEKVIEMSHDKTTVELKKAIVEDEDMRTNHSAYIQKIVRGAKLQELEDAGSIMKDPDTGKYL